MAVKALRKIQLGRETVAGTAVAATSVWRGLGDIEDQQEVVFPEEYTGILHGTDRSYIGSLMTRVIFDPVPATFQQILHPLEAGIVTVGTGASDGSGSAKIYNYAFPTTSAAVSTIKTYTIEAGDDQQAEEVEYCVVDDLTLEGKAGEAWMVSANWFGRQVTTTTFTGAIALATVEDMLFSKTKLYIDPVASAFGTTQKSNTLLAAKLNVKPGWVPAPPMDGNLYFPFAKNVGGEFLLDITFEHDATSVAEKAAWRAQTARALQLKCEGSSAATPGTTYNKQTMIINLAGKWKKFDKIGDLNGNDIVVGQFVGRYNAANTKFGAIIVAVEVNSVP